MERPKRILIFGGAFNPPTLAHEAIIAACLALPQFDEVWLMPSGDRPDKHIGGDDAHRLAMLRLLQQHSFDSSSKLRVSDFELALPRPTATHQTARELEMAHPAAKFWFVFGRDAYLDMPNWPGGERLKHDLNMVVFLSGAGPAVDAPNVTVLDIPATYEQTSSSLVRSGVAANQAVHMHVSPAVHDYIRHNKLYQG